jgi:hypothetical protein
MGHRIQGPICGSQLGRNWIDSGTMCRSKSSSPGCVGMIHQAPVKLSRGQSPIVKPTKSTGSVKRPTDCEQAKADLAEALKLRDAFADEELLKRATSENWDVETYNKRVVEKAFAKAKGGKDERKGNKHKNEAFSPMGTDPKTCELDEKSWHLSDYQNHGFADISYPADLAHEAVHHDSCESLLWRPGAYKRAMSNCRNLSHEEVEAYNAKIEFLQDWLQKHCTP